MLLYIFFERIGNLCNEGKVRRYRIIINDLNWKIKRVIDIKKR